MTKRTTDEWEALLEDTPPAPWKSYALERHPNSDTYIIGADGRRVAGSDRSDAAVPHGSTDLVTAAPEAVAEVVRLRRALEQLRDMYDALATGDCAVASQHRNSRDALTRILEGGTDG